MNAEEAAEKTGMRVEEVEVKEEEVLELCTCTECPTYVEGDSPQGYCFPTNGKSEKITEEVTCICGECPVYEEMGLEHGYYCTRGPEVKQKG